jgi:phosphate transport system substrate-binding protein
MRFQGSNTIGAELVPALVRAFLQQKNLLNVTIEPRVRNLIRVTATDPGATKPVAVEIYQGGSNSAFPDLAKGSVDIGMSSRKVTAMEAASLTAQGDMNSRDCEHVLALDGIAVVVNPANPVNSLTIPSLRAIFSGQNTAWSELSRFSQPIHVYARVEDSGTTDSFERLVMGNELTHVVQQREGRVSAPASGSLPINDDPALENEADASARRIRGFIIVRCRGGRAGRSSDEVRRRETTRTGSGRGRSRPEEEEKK